MLLTLEAFRARARFSALLLNDNLELHNLQPDNLDTPWWSFLLGATGVIGIAIHVHTLSPLFGGFTGLLSSLFSNSSDIRMENADVSSIGIQASYLGWIACALWACGAVNRNASLSLRALYVGSWIIVFTANLAMIDRTRPFWIICTSLLTVLSMTPSRLGTIRALALSSSIAAVLLGVFVAVALWIGKIGDHIPGESLAAAALFNITLYGTAGFAYFDAITAYLPEHTFLPERTLYPLYKALSALGLAATPPSQILEFEAVPHEVNVGTFLTPLYLDGGWLLVCLALPILVVLVDEVALYLLASRSLVSRFGWSTLCFAQLFAFFTTHLTSAPTWIFVALGLLACVAYEPVKSASLDPHAA